MIKRETPLETANRRETYVLSQQWAVGFNDRGMGAGDYAAILLKDDFVYPESCTEAVIGYYKNFAIKCPNRAVVEHVVELHNESLK